MYSRRPLTRNVKYGSSLNFLFSAKDEHTLGAFLKSNFVFFQLFAESLFSYFLFERHLYVLFLSKVSPLLLLHSAWPEIIIDSSIHPIYATP